MTRWAVVAIVCMGLLSASGVALARGGEIISTVQLVAGTVGGAIMGLMGLWAGGCPLALPGEAAPLGCVVAGAYGYLIGVPVGATLGVIIAGTGLGAAGDTLLAAVGAALGEALGLGALAVAIRAGAPDQLTATMALGLVPFASALGATVGYAAGDGASFAADVGPVTSAFPVSVPPLGD